VNDFLSFSDGVITSDCQYANTVATSAPTPIDRHSDVRRPTFK